MEVNRKNLVVVGEGCESPHSCIQNAAKRQQFCGKLDVNIFQKREYE